MSKDTSFGGKMPELPPAFKLSSPGFMIIPIFSLGVRLDEY